MTCLLTTYDVLNTTMTCLLTTYKAFIRPHLDYTDTVYDKPGNEFFKDWFEKIQCKSTLAITGAIRGTSRERNHNELGLDSLVDRV